MVKLQYFDGTKWDTISEWVNAHLAWISLGRDNHNYRVIDADENILRSSL